MMSAHIAEGLIPVRASYIWWVLLRAAAFGSGTSVAHTAVLFGSLLLVFWPGRIGLDPPIGV
jgi:hypothetical protein